MNVHKSLEEIEHSYGIVYCKECELIDNCPIQKEKDEHEGNPFKKILGCSNGVRLIIIVKRENHGFDLKKSFRGKQ